VAGSVYGAPAVPMRCAYTDLDGTLLGHHGSLFRDAEGNFSLRQARMLEACHRAGVEVAIMSGRREAQVMADARLLGQTSYIYEAGCGVVIDGERTLLTGDWLPDEEETPAERMLAAGIPNLLFERFGKRLEWHRPWHRERQLSHLFRGLVDVDEANALLAEHGHSDIRFLDNGAIVRSMEGIDGPAHAYHLVPGGASKAKAVGFHMRARGYVPEECIGIGDSMEDLDACEFVGRFFVVANGPERDPDLREAIAARSNVTVTEGRNGDGAYEAVISTLAGRF
jgi:phosphoglycolate phosphatase